MAAEGVEPDQAGQAGGGAGTSAEPDGGAIPLYDRLAIADLITEFCWRADHGEAAAIPDLFTEEGRLLGPGLGIHGKAALEALFARRAADTGRFTRHFWSNLRLSRLAPHQIRAEMLVRTLVGEGTPPGRLTSGMAGDSIDIVEKGADGRWRFVERRLVVAFRDDG